MRLLASHSLVRMTTGNARAKRLGKDAARFTVVNIAATAVALVLFNLMVHGIRGLYAGPAHDHPLTSYVVANSLGMVVSYLGSRFWVYAHRAPVGPAGGLLAYAVVNLASFVIPVGCLQLTRSVFGWDTALADNLSGNVIGSMLAAVFRFWAFRRFVFLHADEPLEQAPYKPLLVQRVLRLLGLADSGPEVGPGEPELLEHQPQQRDADADHVVRVAGHPRDERSA